MNADAGVELLRCALGLLRLKGDARTSAMRRAVVRSTHVKMTERTERDLVKALEPVFRRQIGEIADGLAELSLDKTPGALVRTVFNPDDPKWDREIKEASLPVLAVSMARAAKVHLATLGFDIGKMAAKSTTATDWLESHPGDWDELQGALEASGVDVSFLAEYPPEIKAEIAAQLNESFKQPYWAKISETTAGDAEAYLRRGLEDGWSIARISSTMANSFMEDTGKYAKRRATNIARTESSNALNGARRASQDYLKLAVPPEVAENIRSVWISVLGNTTRDTHADLDGVPADDDGLWNLAGYMIPWPGHFSLPPGERCNCFPAGVLVSGDFVGAQRAWYKGSLTEIVTGSGGRIALTPNHPVVTAQGLLPASRVKPGDQVLSYCAKVDPAAMMGTRGDDVKGKPSPIEKVFEAFLAAGDFPLVGSVEVRRADVDDFHGDAAFFDGEIDVVRADWKLLQDGISGKFEKRGDSVFVLESEELPVEAGHRPGAFGGGSVDAVSSGFPGLAEPGFHRPFGGVTPAGTLAVGIAADFKASLNEPSSEEGTGISGFLRDSLERYAGSVAFDDVVEVRDFDFAGHVYDLQSRYGTIVAYGEGSCNGIVTSNCQCTIGTELGMTPADARELLDEYAARAGEVV